MRKLFLLLFVLSSLIYIFRFQTTGFGVYGDGLGYYSYDRSFFFDHDLNFNNEFQVWQHQYSKMFNQVRMPENIKVNHWSIGSAILWFPFFVLGHLVALILTIFKIPVELNGYSWPYELAVGVGNIALGLVSLYLLFDLGKKYVGKRLSLTGIILLTFGTNLLFYLMYEPVTSHIPSLFLFTTFLWLWEKDNMNALLLGVVSGLLVATRPQDIVLILPFLILQFFKNKKSFMVITLVAILAFLPQIFVWQKLFGSITRIPYLAGGEAGSFSFWPRHLWEVLFSIRHGLFLWTPLLVLGLWGIKFFSNVKLAKLLLVGFVLEVLITSSWSQWWQGASFGGRFFVSSLPLVFFGLVGLLNHYKFKVTPYLSIAVIYNCLLFILFILKIVQ